MSPIASRKFASVVATLTLGTFLASPALGALSASPNPSPDGSYTVTGSVSTPAGLWLFQLVETTPQGTTRNYALLDPNNISESFEGKSPGTYTYQVRGCSFRNSPDERDVVTCEDFGSSLSVTVSAAPSNTAPVADAGTNSTVNENASVTLDGSDSSDADGDTLSYSWSQTSGATVTLSSTTAASPTFTAPDLVASQTLVFSLTVNDGTIDSAADSVSVRVIADNDDPTADAGSDRMVPTGASVTLDGSDSDDPEGRTLTYSWRQTSGTTVSLSSTTAASPTFTAPSARATLVFSLTVRDGVNTSAADSVTITVNNRPVADAGSNRTVTEGGSVTLDGSDSADANGDTLTYSWSQTLGTKVSLSSTTAESPTFTAPELIASENLYFSLTVNDGTVDSIADTVRVRVIANNDRPTADAGDDQTVAPGATVMLDGSDSSDPEGRTLTYSWSQTSGTTVALSSATAESPTFTAPDTAGRLVFSLRVNDGVRNSLFVDRVTIRVVQDPPPNSPPVAEAGSNQTVSEGDSVTLNGTGSDDPDEDDLTYAWSQTDGTTVTLSSATAASPTFTAPELIASENLYFSLTVNDGTVDSAADTVRVRILADNDPPTADAGDGQTVDAGDTVTLSGSGTDPEDRTLTYAWIQTSGTTVTLSSSTVASPAFTAPDSGGTLVFSFTVRDGVNTSTADTVTVTVTPPPPPPGGLSATPNPSSDGNYTVSWSAVGGVDGYRLYERTGTRWTRVTPYPVTTGRTHAVTGKDPGSYVYRLNTCIEEERESSQGNIRTIWDCDSTGWSNLTVRVTEPPPEVQPTANAGSDQIVQEEAAVTLSGSAERGTGTGSFTYEWTQTQGTTVTLSTTNPASPTFTAPNLLANEDLVFSLVVSDSAGASAPATVTITVEADNDPPTAEAGDDQSVDTGARVTLSGSGTDPESQPLTYAWTKASDSNVTLTNGDKATASFTAPSSNATLEFRLTVSDGVKSATDTVTVTVSSNTLTASPNPSLDGNYTVSGSISTSLRLQSYRLQESGSASGFYPVPDLSDISQSFTSRSAGTYTYQAQGCRVNPRPGSPQVCTDIGGAVTVTVAPATPGGFAASPNPGTTGDYELSWNASTGATSYALETFRDNAWTAVPLDAATATTKTYMDQPIGSYDYRVKACLGSACSDPTDTLTVVVKANSPPVANAGPDRTGDDAVTEGDAVTLSGSGTDPDGSDSDLSYAWTKTSGPDVTLTNDDKAIASFTAPELLANEDLVFSLRVSDGTASDTDTVTVTVRADNDPPTAEAGDDQFVTTGARVTLSGSGTDPESQPLTYAWMKTSGPNVTLTNGDKATASFTAPSSNATLMFRLTVSDGVKSATDTVTVTVSSNKLTASPNPSPDGSYTVSGSATPRTLQQFFRLAETGPGSVTRYHAVPNPHSISVSFTGRSAGEHTYQAQGCVSRPNPSSPSSAYGGCGDIGSPVTVTVRLPTAQLDADPNPSTTGSYTVTGSATPAAHHEYLRLLETGPGNATQYYAIADPGAISQAFTSRPVGTYDYQVQGCFITATPHVHTVCEGLGEALSVRVTEPPPIVPPTVDAGEDRIVRPGAMVELSGTATGPDDQTLSYAWMPAEGTNATLTDANTLTPSFTAPSTADTLDFVFTVNASGGGSASDTVTITVNNLPVAHAGTGFQAVAGTMATLDGSMSNDADGDTLTYAWTAPPDLTDGLTGATTVRPSFTAPQVPADQDNLTLRFTLTVNDGKEDSEPASVLVTVVPPSLSASPNPSPNGNYTVRWPAVSGVDGYRLYERIGTLWTRVTPFPVTTEQSHAVTGKDPGSYDYRLNTCTEEERESSLGNIRTIWDCESAGWPELTVVVLDPVEARAGEDRIVRPGATVMLNGSATGPDGQSLSYAWAPAEGTQATLTDTNSLTPSFTAPSEAGVLEFMLTVTASGGGHDTDTVTITVNNRPVAHAGTALEVVEGRSVRLDGSLSDDADDGDTLKYLWTAPSGHTEGLTDADKERPLFSAPELEPDQESLALRFTLTVNDGKEDSEPASVLVTVVPAPPPDSLTATPNPSPDGSYTVSGSATPRTLQQFFRLVETSPGGVTRYHAVPNPHSISVSFTGRSAGEHTYQAQGCVSRPNPSSPPSAYGGCGDIGSSLTVTVTPPVTAEAGEAGEDGIVRPGATVMLDGSGTGPDGQSLTYAWMQTDGARVSLTGTDTLTPSFTAPNTADTLKFRLTVTASGGGSASDTVTITVNTRPVAHAGTGQEVESGATVTLDGSMSRDDDGDTLTYAWTAPSGLTDGLTDAAIVGPMFRAPELEQEQDSLALRFTLTVNDGKEASEPATVTITVANRAPVAEAGDDLSGDGAVTEDTEFTLDGSLSSDPDGDPLTYRWSRPDGVAAGRVDPENPARSTFVAPNLTGNRDLVFELTVNDGKVDSAEDTVTVSVLADNDPPTVEAGENRTVDAGASVTLNGSGTDPEGQKLTYAWTQTSGTNVTLMPNPTDAPERTFTAPGAATTLVFELSVNDGANTATDSVTVTVEDDPPQFPVEMLSARTWTQNTPIAAFTVPAATGGHGTLRYSIAGQPGGVRLSGARVVSGTPATAGMGTATVTVTDDNNRTDTLTFDWTVQPAPVQDGTRSRPHILPDPVSVSAKDIFGLLRPAVPAASGASVTHFRFTVPLDRAGTWTIAIDGTPNAGSDWDLQGDGGRRSTSRNADERIRVSLTAGRTYNFSVFPFSYTHWTTLTGMKLTLTPPASTGAVCPVDTLGPYTWIQGVAIEAFSVPQATGGDVPLTYSAAGLPAGVTMAPNRIVSGTPTAAGSGTATVTVTDSRGRTCTMTFEWTVEVDTEPMFASTSLQTRQWTEGTVITAFAVPAATGGNAPLTYTARRLPSGVTMASSRSVSGTPTHSGSHTAIITVRDRDGDTATAVLPWTVSPGTGDLVPSFGSATIADQAWSVRTAIASLTVPAATSGDGTLTYTVENLPDGVSMSTQRVLSGSPTATGSGTATVTATDADGDFDKLAFDWKVSAGVPPAPGRPTGPDTDADGVYTIAWESVTGATRYELEASRDGGPWSAVSTTGTGTSKAFAGQASGELHYRVRACNAEGCSDWSPIKMVLVILPPTVGFDSTYVARSGDLDMDGDTDIYLSPLATGTGNVGEFILENADGTFSLQTSPSVAHLGSAQTWTVSTQLQVVLEDINVDGVWDAFVTGITDAPDTAGYGGAVDQIVVSPRVKGAVPTGLVAVDADLKSFIDSVMAWYKNLAHFDTTLEQNSLVFHGATTDRFDILHVFGYRERCIDDWGSCRRYTGTLTNYFGSTAACVSALTVGGFTFVDEDGSGEILPREEACGEVVAAFFGVLQESITVKDFSSVSVGAIEDVVKFIKIWEAGEPDYQVEDLADVLEDVLGITVGGYDFSGIEDEDLDDSTEQRIFEVHQGLLNINALFGRAGRRYADDYSPGNVIVTKRRVGRFGWLERDWAWHVALEWTALEEYPALMDANPTIAAYLRKYFKLKSERNHPSERNNQFVGIVSATDPSVSAFMWLALVESDRKYRSCPALGYALAPRETEVGKYNSNGYIAGIINSIGATTNAPLDSFYLGDVPVPSTHFESYCAAGD